MGYGVLHLRSEKIRFSKKNVENTFRGNSHLTLFCSQLDLNEISELMDQDLKFENASIMANKNRTNPITETKITIFFY